MTIVYSKKAKKYINSQEEKIKTRYHFDTIPCACLPYKNIDGELSKEEQEMLILARHGEYEPLDT